MANIKNRVLQQLGQSNSDYLDDVSNHADVFTKAYWEALKLMPPRMLIGNIWPPLDPEVMIPNTTVLPNTVGVDDKKELLVFRTEANHVMDNAAIQTPKYITRPCKRISIENSRKALDPDSIYYATAHSPVYWYGDDANDTGVPHIMVAPTTTGWTNSSGGNARLHNNFSAIKVYMLMRYIFTDTDVSLTDGSALTSFPLPDAKETAAETTHKDLPEEFEGFIIKKIAHAFLIEKIANAAVIEEDGELVGILTAESQTLSELIGQDVANMNEQWGVNE
jgi:CBS domain-containing protein